MSGNAGANVDVIVLSNIDAEKLKFEVQNDHAFPVLQANDAAKDSMDLFNHPRQRRALILSALLDRRKQNENIDGVSIFFETVKHSSAGSMVESINDVYKNVHSAGLIKFLVTAWNKWEALGEEGRDPSGYLHVNDGVSYDLVDIPPLIPCCFPLPRDPYQCLTNHVLGQVAYYCTDTVTPVFRDLLLEISDDTELVRKSVDYVTSSTNDPVVFIIPTHPGHHSAFDSFGGYCYLNHAAACADLLKQKLEIQRKSNPVVAILDIDYHCGNGTASIFYDDPSVLVISIHCHPDFEYPFHSGFSNQTGIDDGEGTTLHLPLPPGTRWIDSYKNALEEAVSKIRTLNVNALVVSMGLDTYDKDPCAIRRAGFCLEGNDYIQIGRTIASGFSLSLPTIFIQEGGYRMDAVGSAAADVVTAYAEQRRSLSL